MFAGGGPVGPVEVDVRLADPVDVHAAFGIEPGQEFSCFGDFLFGGARGVSMLVSGGHLRSRRGDASGRIVPSALDVRFAVEAA